MERHSFATFLLGLLAIPALGVLLVAGGLIISLVLVVPMVAVEWVGQTLFGPINLRTPLLLAIAAIGAVVAYELLGQWFRSR